MAISMVCDSCGLPTMMSERTQVLLPSDGTVAGAQVDLCPACADAVQKDAKVKKAKDNFVKRMTLPPKG